jgi:hypothetical protein
MGRRKQASIFFCSEYFPGSRHSRCYCCANRFVEKNAPATGIFEGEKVVEILARTELKRVGNVKQKQSLICNSTVIA